MADNVMVTFGLIHQMWYAVMCIVSKMLNLAFFIQKVGITVVVSMDIIICIRTCFLIKTKRGLCHGNIY